jgi:hypothetical protein
MTHAEIDNHCISHLPDEILQMYMGKLAVKSLYINVQKNELQTENKPEVVQEITRIPKDDLLHTTSQSSRIKRRQRPSPLQQIML